MGSVARFFQIGTLIYSLAMIACAWAPDANTLIIIRFVQGFGMALFLPTTFAIATAMYGPERRGSALGILQAANAVGFVMGPIFEDGYSMHMTGQLFFGLEFHSRYLR